MLIGGNEERENFILNLESMQWRKAGSLPKLHWVTNSLNVTHGNGQTLTLFTQVNFEKNCMELCSAINSGHVSPFGSSQEWTWLAKLEFDIKHFQIKNAFIFQNYLIIGSRGQPSGIVEACCSFLLVLKMNLQGGQIVSLNPTYDYIKINPESYPENHSQVHVRQRGENLMLRMT